MEEKKKHITTFLKELGIPASIMGYYYLRYAIELLIDDITLIKSVTKTIYPKVAQKFDTTTSRAERAMRHAIEVGWLRGNETLLINMFGYSVSADKGKPTNIEFMATVADYILINS